MTDTTEFSLFGQKMYLSPALDSHNSYLVGYTLSDQSALDMAPPMLEKAHTSIPDEIELISILIKAGSVRASNTSVCARGKVFSKARVASVTA